MDTDQYHQTEEELRMSNTKIKFPVTITYMEKTYQRTRKYTQRTDPGIWRRGG